MSEYITLKDNRDFSGLYRRGKSFVGPVLVTYVLKNKSDNLRFGITNYYNAADNWLKDLKSKQKIEDFFQNGNPETTKKE